MLFHFSLVVKIESGQKFSFIILGQSHSTLGTDMVTQILHLVSKNTIYIFLLKKSLSQFRGENVMTDHVSCTVHRRTC